MSNTRHKDLPSLHYAAIHGDEKTAKKILENPENHYLVSLADSNGDLPLDRAAARGHDEISNLFIQIHATTEYKYFRENSQGFHPIISAAYWWNKTLQGLTQWDKRLGTFNETNPEKAFFNIMKNLITYYPSICKDVTLSSPDQAHNTNALYFIVILMCNSSAAVGNIDIHKNNAKHIAKKLIEQGVSLRLRNSLSGKHALDYARKHDTNVYNTLLNLELKPKDLGFIFKDLELRPKNASPPTTTVIHYLSPKKTETPKKTDSFKIEEPDFTHVVINKAKNNTPIKSKENLFLKKEIEKPSKKNKENLTKKNKDNLTKKNKDNLTKKNKDNLKKIASVNISVKTQQKNDNLSKSPPTKKEAKDIPFLFTFSYVDQILNEISADYKIDLSKIDKKTHTKRLFTELSIFNFTNCEHKIFLTQVLKNSISLEYKKHSLICFFRRKTPIFKYDINTIKMELNQFFCEKQKILTQ